MSEAREHKVGLRELAVAFVAKANFTYGGGSATITSCTAISSSAAGG